MLCLISYDGKCKLEQNLSILYMASCLVMITIFNTHMHTHTHTHTKQLFESITKFFKFFFLKNFANGIFIQVFINFKNTELVPIICDLMRMLIDILCIKFYLYGEFFFNFISF